MNTRVIIRGNQIFRKTTAFTLADQIDADVKRTLPVSDDETLVGIYWNTSDELSTAVIVTDVGLHMGASDAPRFVAYSEIRSVGFKPENKTTDDNIYLSLSDGSEALIVVSRGEGKFRDLCDFARFLMRVVELDVQ